MALPTAHTELSLALEAPSPPTTSVLLFAAEPSASRVAQYLAEHLGASVASACDAKRCAELLQMKSYRLVVMEEVLAQEHAKHLGHLYALAANAVTLQINFGTSDMQRVLLEARAALLRRKNDIQTARRLALQSLQDQFGPALTSLLLESQLALRLAGPAVAPALEHFAMLAESLFEELRQQGLRNDPVANYQAQQIRIP